MPVNEKILFSSFQYLFSLKTILYAILLSAMLRENHAVLGGKKYRFPRGGGEGGEINIRFRPKYRPLPGRKVPDPDSQHCWYLTWKAELALSACLWLSLYYCIAIFFFWTSRMYFVFGPECYLMHLTDRWRFLNCDMNHNGPLGDRNRCVMNS